jgi:hypothetical protein
VKKIDDEVERDRKRSISRTTRVEAEVERGKVVEGEGWRERRR